MKIGVYGKNIITEKIVCFDGILAESLEAGIDFYTRKLEDIPSTEYTEIGYLDLEEEGFPGIGSERHDGVWYSQFSAQVGGWRYIRDERDSLLFMSDWTGLTDAPLSAEKKIEWKEYRETLRNIPQAFDSPVEVVFPTKPEK
jgi:hypothetical protein